MALYLVQPTAPECPLRFMKSSGDGYSYRAFGLGIRSSIALPLPPPARCGPYELEVHRGPIDHLAEAKRVDGVHRFWTKERRACHILDGVGAFLVIDGAEILVDLEDDARDALVQLSILGPAMGLTLIQSGLYVLHGSAVAIEGQGVGFLGRSGTGKSTIAAALHSLGHSFVSDDLTAVSIPETGPQVVPSYPRLKLWADAAHSLDMFSDDLPRVHPGYDKRIVDVESGFSSSPQPLRRLYVLDIGEKVSIQPFSAIQSFDIIVANWYGARFGRGCLEMLDLSEFFSQAGLLAREVPIKRLTRPTTLADEPNLTETIAREIVRDLREYPRCPSRHLRDPGTQSDTR